jgi:hypothetical protein
MDASETLPRASVIKRTTTRESAGTVLILWPEGHFLTAIGVTFSYGASRPRRQSKLAGGPTDSGYRFPACAR